MQNILKFIGKIFLYLILCILVMSCTYTQEERKEDQEKTKRALESSIEYDIIKIEYEGHYYLLWNRPSRGGICHDQNCECLKDSL